MPSTLFQTTCNSLFHTSKVLTNHSTSLKPSRNLVTLNFSVVDTTTDYSHNHWLK